MGLFSFLRGRRSQPQPTAATKTDLGVESLEGRLSPASLYWNPTVSLSGGGVPGVSSVVRITKVTLPGGGVPGISLSGGGVPGMWGGGVPGISGGGVPGISGGGVPG